MLVESSTPPLTALDKLACGSSATVASPRFLPAGPGFNSRPVGREVGPPPKLGLRAFEHIEDRLCKLMERRQLVNLDQALAYRGNALHAQLPEHPVHMNKRETEKIAHVLLSERTSVPAVVTQAGASEPAVQFDQHSRDTLRGISPPEADHVIMEPTLFLGELERDTQSDGGLGLEQLPQAVVLHADHCRSSESMNGVRLLAEKKTLHAEKLARAKDRHDRAAPVFEQAGARYPPCFQPKNRVAWCAGPDDLVTFLEPNTLPHFLSETRVTTAK